MTDYFSPENTTNNAPDEVQVITFGCRLNFYESQAIKELAQKAGLKKKIIINTCAVTAEAERQARQMIRRLKREAPQVEIIVTGCSVQINPAQYKDMVEVDRIIGNHDKMELKTYTDYGHQERIVLQNIMEVKETATHLITGFEGKARAFVQIQNGCNHRCTFCTIPYGRGNSRSVALGQIVSQIQKLLDQGFQEIVLTGVDITDYGLDLPAQPRLGQMIYRLLRLLPQLKRLRLSSLDPVEIDEDLWQLLGSEPRLLPHLHLSLQAGDDMILKRMKRRHRRQHVIDFCKRARALRPDVVFGADIIAGFPTESEEQFENSRRLIEECDLTYLHVFPYSARPNTPAARMPQLTKSIIKERAKTLRTEGKKALTLFFKRFTADYHEQLIPILIESVETDHLYRPKTIIGRTDHFAPIALQWDEKKSFIKNPQELTGRVVKAIVKGYTDQGLEGLLVER